MKSPRDPFSAPAPRAHLPMIGGLLLGLLLALPSACSNPSPPVQVQAAKTPVTVSFPNGTALNLQLINVRAPAPLRANVNYYSTLRFWVENNTVYGSLDIRVHSRPVDGMESIYRSIDRTYNQNARVALLTIAGDYDPRKLQQLIRDTPHTDLDQPGTPQGEPNAGRSYITPGIGLFERFSISPADPSSTATLTLHQADFYVRALTPK